MRIRRHEENITNDFDHVRGILEDELRTTQNFYTQRAIDKKLFERLSTQFHYKLAEHFFHADKFSEANGNYLSSLVLKQLNWRAVAKLIISSVKS